MNSSSYGEISVYREAACWKIPYYPDYLPSRCGMFMDSPRFQLHGSTWYLRLFPRPDFLLSGFDIWLVRLASSFSKQRYWCKMGYSDSTGFKSNMDCIRDVFIKEMYFQNQKLFGCQFCCYPHPQKVVDTTFYTGTVTCDVFPFEIGLETTASKDSSSQTEIERPASGPSSYGKDKPKELPSLGKLQLDYKNLLKSGARSDVLIDVSGQEFRAHRNILGARSPVFDAMLKHEDESGKPIAIDDLDHPGVFRDFLEYIYAGSAGDLLSDENAFGLYAAADKYDIQELKSEALQHIRGSLTVESFCDVVALAFLHGEDDLLQHAVDFSRKNLPEILATAKWQTLLRENSTVANELLMKAVEPGLKDNE